MASDRPITGDERHRTRTAAWLAPSRVRIGERGLRPLSFGSLVLCERLGIDLAFRCDDPERILDWALAYLWAHAEPLEDVLWHVWADTWEDAVGYYDFTVDIETLAPVIGGYIREILHLADAQWVEIRPRETPAPGDLADTPPADLVSPDFRALLLSEASRSLPGMSETALLWEMPLPRLLGYWHAARWREGDWTCAATSADPLKVDAAVAALRVVEDLARTVAPPPRAGGMAALLAKLEGLAG